MQKIKIEEEMLLHKHWKIAAQNVKTPKELEEFVSRLLTMYEHDYGTIVHAIEAAMLAAYSVMQESDQGGITGFQASCLGWALARKFLSIGNCGARMWKFEDLLFPQYEDRFAKTIGSDVWEKIQREALKKIDEDGTDASITAHSDVRKHWESIVAGTVPFGFIVDKDD